jgi:predicted membrane protein
MSKETFGASIIAIFLVLGIVFIASLIFALPVMLLWNWLMPAIFGLVKISFWQAWGLSFLSGLLFRPTSSSSK